jgi:hypothetical protein
MSYLIYPKIVPDYEGNFNSPVEVFPTDSAFEVYTNRLFTNTTTQTFNAVFDLQSETEISFTRNFLRDNKIFFVRISDVETLLVKADTYSFQYHSPDLTKVSMSLSEWCSP